MPHLLTRLPRLAALVAMAALAVAVMAGPASAKSKAPQPRESRTYLGTVAGSDAFGVSAGLGGAGSSSRGTSRRWPSSVTWP